MTSDLHVVFLSDSELKSLLHYVSTADPGLADELRHSGHTDVKAGRTGLTVNVERVRGILTEALAQVGFDQNYAATGDGREIETLIDKLFGALK